VGASSSGCAQSEHRILQAIGNKIANLLMRTNQRTRNLSFWLVPDQVRVIALNDDEALIAYAQTIVTELRANMVRVDADFSATPFKAKIGNAV
jgi:threonyl-tRNA synthetase